MQVDLYKQVSCVILSAGSSLRMGSHKALLAYDQERNFLQKITSAYSQAGIEEVIVVVNAGLLKMIQEAKMPLPQHVKLVVNHKPGLGRFYSLQTGLQAVSPGHSCFFQNIDNPFVSGETLEGLINCSSKADVIKPCFGGKSGHPVLISPSVIRAIIAEPDYTNHIDAFLHGYTLLKVEIQDAGILVNINQADDYNKTEFNV